MQPCLVCKRLVPVDHLEVHVNRCLDGLEDPELEMDSGSGSGSTNTPTTTTGTANSGNNNNGSSSSRDGDHLTTGEADVMLQPCPICQQKMAGAALQLHVASHFGDNDRPSTPAGGRRNGPDEPPHVYVEEPKNNESSGRLPPRPPQQEASLGGNVNRRSVKILSEEDSDPAIAFSFANNNNNNLPAKPSPHIVLASSKVYVDCPACSIRLIVANLASHIDSHFPGGTAIPESLTSSARQPAAVAVDVGDSFWPENVRMPPLPKGLDSVMDIGTAAKISNNNAAAAATATTTAATAARLPYPLDDVPLASIAGTATAGSFLDDLLPVERQMTSMTMGGGREEEEEEEVALEPRFLNRSPPQQGAPYPTAIIQPILPESIAFGEVASAASEVGMYGSGGISSSANANRSVVEDPPPPFSDY